MPFSGVQTCALDRKSTRLNSSHTIISYAVFCLEKKIAEDTQWSYQIPAGAFQDGDNASLTYTATLDHGSALPSLLTFFFFNDTATTEIYTLSLHDALPI